MRCLLTGAEIYAPLEDMPNLSRICLDRTVSFEESLRARFVFNTDQGSQFTSEGFTGILARHGVKISMDGKGRYADNIFMERLWRTVKYEEVYLKAYSNGREAKAGLEAYLHFYNTQRPHQALGYRTPAEVFSGDSVQSDEQSKGRRWLPTRALVDLGKTAGPSLNIAPILSN